MTAPTTTPPSPELSRAERKLGVALAFASRILSHSGHDDLNQGQVSARMPGAARFLIKGALVGFDEATPGDMVLAPVSSGEAAPPLAPPELPLHQEIYAARRDVGAIVHSHAPYSLVFGATDWELRPLSHDGAFFAGHVPRYARTSNTVLDSETGREIADVLGSASAAFLRNHGAVVVGATVREATIAAHLLERAAHLQIIAEGAGVPYTSAVEADVEAKRAFVYGAPAIRSYWDHAVRRVRAAAPETAAW